MPSWPICCIQFILFPLSLNRQAFHLDSQRLRFIWLQDCRKGICSCKVDQKTEGRVWIWLKNWPTGPVLFETELDHPKPCGEFPWQAWWFSLDFGSQGFFFQSFGRDLQQWLPLQLRTEQWKDCFVQGMDSCILAAWHGKPEGLVGFARQLRLSSSTWKWTGGSRSLSK